MTYDYHEPSDWPQALALLAQRGDEATVLAGGTAFTLLLRQGLIRPSAVVGLRKIRDAGRIDVDGHGGLSIGTRWRSPPCLRTTTCAARAASITGASDAGSACATLPPSVAWFRTRTVATFATASASSGHAPRTAAERTTAVCVAVVPMESPP